MDMCMIWAWYDLWKCFGYYLNMKDILLSYLVYLLSWHVVTYVCTIRPWYILWSDSSLVDIKHRNNTLTSLIHEDSLIFVDIRNRILGSGFLDFGASWPWPMATTWIDSSSPCLPHHWPCAGIVSTSLAFAWMAVSPVWTLMHSSRSLSVSWEVCDLNIFQWSRFCCPVTLLTW